MKKIKECFSEGRNQNGNFSRDKKKLIRYLTDQAPPFASFTSNMELFNYSESCLMLSLVNVISRLM
jgi:hypothetical protein